MKYLNKYVALMSTFSVALLVSIVLSCGDDGGSGPNGVIPSDLAVSISIQGSDAANPTGDGSGVVEFVATATDAARYQFDFGGSNIVFSTSGMVSHTFQIEGETTYEVVVTAFSSTGNSIEIMEDVRVLVTATPMFSTLVHFDEFDTDGAVDGSKWIHETEGPNNGRWWNDEKQHYTDRLDNSYVSDGTLKIVAKREDYSSGGVDLNYTSARLNSRFTFTYGRIDVRAKLPFGQGTWPAIWMLGESFNTVGWPACGEIDIMEHWGHDPTKVHSATHTTACSGGCNDARVGTTTVSTYDSEFHNYTAIWTEEKIEFLVDGELLYDYNPINKNVDNWPFTSDQFILLNVAMGGSWFSIDPAFTESTMEIDYVRVYQ